MPKIKKEFKRFFKLLIDENKLEVKCCEKMGEISSWEYYGIYEKDFKIEAKKFGKDAGILKVEIGVQEKTAGGGIAGKIPEDLRTMAKV